MWGILRKAVLLPVIIALTLAEWGGTFLAGTINFVINLIALLLLLVAGLSALLGIASGMEALRMVAVALGAVVVSNLLICMVGVIRAARLILIERI